MPVQGEEAYVEDSLCFCALAESWTIHVRLMMKFMTASAFKRKQLTPEEFSLDNKVDADITEHLYCLCASVL